jgi:dihydropteroate synthase
MLIRLMPSWIANGRVLIDSNDTRPKIMGIVNTTPDSFSDGGLAFESASALEHARGLIQEGADLLDVGGESSRPGAEVVPVDEELRRVIPVIEALAHETDRPISVDTVKPDVARQALRAGASIINDIEALTHPELARVAAESDAGVVLMHMRGNPRTMQIDPRYDDVVTEVYDFLARRVDACEAIGIKRERIAIDPGIGFGKTHEHNLALLRGLDRFEALGQVILIGVSRKGFLGVLTGRDRSHRATASAVCSLAAANRGARVVRVHDVGAMADAINVWQAVHGFPRPAAV